MSLSEKDFNIYLDVRAWLAEEIRLKGRKERFIPRTREHASNEYEKLVTELLPGAWEQFQSHRANRLPKKTDAPLNQKLKVAKQVLLTCMYAEESLAFDALVHGRNPVAALHHGFNKMDAYIRNLREVSKSKLPPESELDCSLQSAVARDHKDIHSYEEPVPRLQTVVGLAIVALHEQTGDRALLTKPGRNAENLELWNQPGLL